MLTYGGFSNRERRRESCADPVSDPGQTAHWGTNIVVQRLQRLLQKE